MVGKIKFTAIRKLFSKILFHRVYLLFILVVLNITNFFLKWTKKSNETDKKIIYDILVQKFHCYKLHFKVTINFNKRNYTKILLQF